MRTPLVGPFFLFLFCCFAACWFVGTVVGGASVQNAILAAGFMVSAPLYLLIVRVTR